MSIRSIFRLAIPPVEHVEPAQSRGPLKSVAAAEARCDAAVGIYFRAVSTGDRNTARAAYREVMAARVNLKEALKGD